MKILLLSSYLPYPLYSGGHVRLYNLMKALAKDHEITLFCEMRSHQTADDVLEVKKICKDVITFPRRKQWTAGNILSSGFSMYPFLMTGHTQPTMTDMIESRANEFDLIHVETFYVYHNLPKVTIPTVLVEHNIEYQVYERFLKNLSGLRTVLTPLLLLDVQKIKHWEQHFWQRATALVAVSESDKKIMKRSDVVVVPNGVDVKIYTFQKKRKQTNTLLFIGDFKWMQNRDSVRWIITEIMPKLSKDVTLWIVGKHIPTELKTLSDNPRILFDEHAPQETEKIYAQAALLLAPIRVGGGTSYKILEAMASGVPVVTTQLGAQGLGAMHKKHLWIGKTPDDIATGVDTILTEPEIAHGLSQRGRVFIEEHFTWEKISKKLVFAYEQALRV